MTDKIVSADLALRTGYANAILDPKEFSNDFFDPNLIPVIPSLLAADATTLLNCKKQLSQSRDLDVRNQILHRENRVQYERYLEPDFKDRIAAYLQAVATKKTAQQSNSKRAKFRKLAARAKM